MSSRDWGVVWAVNKTKDRAPGRFLLVKVHSHASGASYWETYGSCLMHDAHFEALQAFVPKVANDDRRVRTV